MVNPGRIFAVVPAGTAAELLADAPRQIRVLVPAAEAAAQLGPGFRRFDAASAAIGVAYVNAALVQHVLPHPEIAGTCLVHGQNRQLAVKGTLAEVRAQLG